MKLNDWIIASLNNPTFEAADFQNYLDMSLDNTQLLSKDVYLNSNYILQNDQFKDKSGNFSQNLFDDFYNKASKLFKEFSTENLVDNYEYSMWDVKRPRDGKVKDIGLSINTVSNPEHVSIGITGINEISNPEQSMRELAQNSKIWDSKNKQWMDKSVNDISLFNNPIAYFQSLFDDPIVYATYDEDTEEINPITGLKELHKKGEWKINEFGEYYTETLNGRSLRGKEIVSAADYITDENSYWNKYDFFDSDDLYKSVGGNIAKNVAAVIPFFIPYVGEAYTGLLISREVAKSLPMMYGVFTGLSGKQETESLLLNKIAAYGEKFTTSTSDYAKQNTFSFENFANLMSEVASQWSQLKLIANGFSKLTGRNKQLIESANAKAWNEYANQYTRGMQQVASGELDAAKFMQMSGIAKPGGLKAIQTSGEWVNTAYGQAAIKKYIPKAQELVAKRMRAGQDLSLVYMAMISNTDVYESILEHGGTPQEAAIIALGSMVGMFSVDKYLGLGEMFFLQDAMRNAIRTGAKKATDEYIGTLGKNVSVNEKNVLNWFLKGLDIGKKAVNKYTSDMKNHTLGFFGKAFGEGLEEVSEELVSDLSKTLGEIAGRFGYFSLTDYGAWDNMFDRYAMNFLGGVAGGGMFYGIDAYLNRGNQATKEFQSDLIYLLRNGKKNEVLKEYERLYKSGKMGDKNLSYNKNSEGVFTTAENEQDSLAYKNYQQLINITEQLDMILNDNDLKLSDDEMFDKMVLGEYRAEALTDFLRDKSKAKEFSFITRYLQDLHQLSDDIATVSSKIDELKRTTPDSLKRESKGNSTTDDKYQSELADLENKLKKLQERRDYLFGEGSLGYVELMLFGMDTTLSGLFTALNYAQFVRSQSGKSILDLTEEEQKSYEKKYAEYEKTKPLALYEAFKVFKNLQNNLTAELQQLKDLNLNLDEMNELLKRSDIFNSEINYNTKLDSESPEEYEHRNEAMKGESDENFKKRQQNRVKQLNELKNEDVLKRISEYAKLPSDTTTFRYLQAAIRTLRLNVLDDFTDELEIDDANVRKLVLDLIKAKGFNNRDEIIDQAKVEASKAIENELNRLYDKVVSDEVYDKYEPIITYILNEKGSVPENLTLSDIAAYVDNLIKNSAEDLKTSEDVINFVKNTLSELSDDEINKILTYRDKLIAAETEVSLLTDEELGNEENQSIIKLAKIKQEGDEIVYLDSDVLDNMINTKIIETKEKIAAEFDKVKEKAEKSTLLKALTDLENTKFIENPVLGIVNAISKKFKTGIEIEPFLKDIYNQYKNGETAADFELTESQIKTLESILQDIEMSKAVIYAASGVVSVTRPIGHNKSINQFAKNHKEVFNNFKELIEIDSDKGTYLILELDKYAREIREWIDLSKSNQSNKTKQFQTFKTNFIKTRIDFFKLNRDIFKISESLDLLEGFDDSDVSEENIIKAEQMLHNRFIEAINKGHSSEILLDILISRLIKNRWSDLKPQLQSKLSPDISYNSLTDYDRFVYLVTCLALDNNILYNNLELTLKLNDKLVPLPLQEYAAKVSLAQQTNPKLINLALDLINSKFNKPFDILYNTSITTGLGGSGKTFAVTTLTIGSGKDTWISGPDESQINNLQQTLKDGTKITKEGLLTQALGSDYSKFKTDPLSFFEKIKGVDDNSTVILKNNIKLQLLKTAPKYIVIDEATHFTTAELLIISKFCKDNNIQLKLLGDTHLSGALSLNMENFGREFVLAWRSPDLYISLRDNNIQKSFNLKSIITIQDILLNSNNRSNEILMSELMQNLIKSLSFKYYNKESLAGEIITNQLTDNLISKLDDDDVIGFIGEETSANYQKLKNSNKKVELLSIDKIQGREFKYVVIDTNLNLEQLRSTYADEVLNTLNQLYTAVSRSKEATIIIDNNVSRFIKSIETEIKGNPTGIQQSAKDFRTTRAEEIAKIKKILVPETTIKQDVKPNNVIDGADITLDDVKDETPEYLQKKLEEVKQATKQTKLIANGQALDSTSNPRTPIRVYSNVSYSGINIDGETWINDNNSNRDLGIYLKPGGQVTTKEDKYHLVQKLIELKCLLVYKDLDLTRVSNENLNIWNNKREIQYYVQVEDAGTYNKLVGLTDLSNESRTINGDKVVSLIAKIILNDGTEYEITLGGLANPKTWEENKDSIIAALNARIDAGKGTDDLIAYRDNLQNYIDKYIQTINDLAQTNSRMRINDPAINGMSTLIDRGHMMRLEEINANTSEFNVNSQYAVTSDVFVLNNTILNWFPEGQTPEYLKKLIGRPVMYVTSNILLNSAELETIFKNQCKDPSLQLQVRILPLYNMGVSFQSLYLNGYKDLYSVRLKDHVLTHPIRYKSAAIRMYIAMWNFRSNLQQFLTAYNLFKTSKNLSDKDIEDLCKLENEYYAKYSEANPNSKSEEEFRNSITDNSIKEKLKLIWDFNDSLADSVRQFRLGFELKNGAYIRKLTNLQNSKLYSDKNHAYGIYINPTIATLYNNALNLIFDNIINKIIPTDRDTTTYLTLESENNINWFLTLKADSKITLLISGDKKEVLDFSGTEKLIMLPDILVKLGRQFNNFLNNPSYLLDDAEAAANVEEDYDSILQVKYTDKDKNITQFDWFNITSAFKDEVYTDGLVQTNEINIASNTKPESLEQTLPGIIYLYNVDSNGNIIPNTLQKTDKRVDNLFNLMFHGLISTKKHNDFSGDEIRATDAKFKFGFLSDPVLVDKVEENDSIPVATSIKLFGAYAVVGLPMLGISIDPYTDTNVNTEETNDEKKKKNNEFEIKKQKIANELSNIGINITKETLDNVDTDEDLFDLVEPKINTIFKEYFLNQKNSDISKLPYKVTMENGKITIHYVTELSELIGKLIISVKVSDNKETIEIETNSGNYILNQDGELSTVIPANTQTIKYGLFEDNVNIALNNITSIIGTSNSDSIAKRLKEIMSRVDRNQDIDNAQYSNYINEFVNKLENIRDDLINDEEDQDDVDMVLKAINLLNESRNNPCTKIVWNV